MAATKAKKKRVLWYLFAIPLKIKYIDRINKNFFVYYLYEQQAYGNIWLFTANLQRLEITVCY